MFFQTDSDLSPGYIPLIGQRVGGMKRSVLPDIDRVLHLHRHLVVRIIFRDGSIHLIVEDPGANLLLHIHDVPSLVRFVGAVASRNGERNQKRYKKPFHAYSIK